LDSKEQAIREFYEARRLRDWDAVGALLADEVSWNEPGDEEFSGETRGREQVLAVLRRLVDVTGGTFQLVPEAFLNAEEYSVVLVRWWAEREGERSEGNDIAVYRVRDRTIDGAWFYSDGYDPETFSAVFSFD
jgi:uncharacterized protein